VESHQSHGVVDSDVWHKGRPVLVLDGWEADDVDVEDAIVDVGSFAVILSKSRVCSTPRRSRRSHSDEFVTLNHI
jgi:hypothetical protein